MTETDRIDHVVDELREMACTGADVASLLRRIQHSFAMNDCKLIGVKCFHKAFGGGIAAVSPIGGWSGFGGELSDAEVESFVSPVIKSFRDRLERGGRKGVGSQVHGCQTTVPDDRPGPSDPIG